MRRFSIRSLMAAVLTLALGLAALRNADDAWAGGTLLVTSLLIAAAALGAFFHAGRKRAARLGFAVFGGGYFALAFLGLSEANLGRLPTSRLLAYVHQRVAPPGQNWALALTSGSGQNTFLLTDVTGTVTGLQPNRMNFIATPSTPGGTPTRWARLLPGAARYEAFGVVGHCQFSVMVGLLGAAVGLRYEARRKVASQAS